TRCASAWGAKAGGSRSRQSGRLAGSRRKGPKVYAPCSMCALSCPFGNLLASAWDAGGTLGLLSEAGGRAPMATIHATPTTLSIPFREAKRELDGVTASLEK